MNGCFYHIMLSIVLLQAVSNRKLFEIYIKTSFCSIDAISFLYSQFYAVYTEANANETPYLNNYVSWIQMRCSLAFSMPSSNQSVLFPVEYRIVLFRHDVDSSLFLPKFNHSPNACAS